VTPNQHALAEEFVLLDNLYDSGSNSADAHQWATPAVVTDYLERSFGGATRCYPFNGGDSLAYAPTGFLWDTAIRHRKSVRVYGEYVNGLRADGGEMGPWLTVLGHGVTEAGQWNDFYRDSKVLSGVMPGRLHASLAAHSDVPSLNRIINRQYPPFQMVIPDQYRVDVFLKEFNEFVRQKTLPDLVIMAPTNDHTQGTRPTFPTPRAMVADNDLALGRVIEAISRSPYWKDSVVFVIEDDAQDGVDHLDGHRTIGQVISPYTRHRAVDSGYYRQIDVMRAMEQILGLPRMNQMDLAVPPSSMKSIFTETADFTPFAARPARIPLDELNPSAVALEGVRQQWAVASAGMDFSVPGRADEELLNRIVWYSAKGFDKPFRGDEHVLSPREVHPYLERRQQ
jgi:hypothetical protein